MMMTPRALSLMSLVVVFLAGCGGEAHQELRSWMREQEQGMRGKVDPLPKVLPYEPLAYESAGVIDPFSPLKAKISGDRQGANLPDMNRPREALEEFPLETLKLVGIFQDKTRLIAQLVANGRGYQAKVGSYVGQSFGRIVRIVTTKNEERIVVKELVKDADDQWVERESELLLDTRGAQ